MITPQPSVTKFILNKDEKQTFKEFSLRSPSPISKFDQDSALNLAEVKTPNEKSLENIAKTTKIVAATSTLGRSLEVISHRMEP